MRASRLLSVLLLLQTRGRLTARQLADALEVSTRTVYRDIESLHAAGVPLYGEAGHDGGYQLLDGYRTRLTGLTEREAATLFLTGLPGPAAELGLGGLVAASRLKLAAALPAALRDRAEAIEQRFHLDAPTWYADGDPSPHLAAVADAVWEQRRVRVRYEGWRGEAERLLEPYGLVLKGGRWYVVADSGRGPATYKVSKILDLAPTEETFDRPAGFDLAGYWAAHVVEFRARLVKGEATIRITPAGRERLAHVTPHLAKAMTAADGDGVGPDGAGRDGAGRDGAGRDGAGRDGWVTVTIPIESTVHAHGELLRLGAEVEVLAPAELRDRLAATARGLADLYRDRPDGLT